MAGVWLKKTGAQMTENEMDKMTNQKWQVRGNEVIQE